MKRRRGRRRTTKLKMRRTTTRGSIRKTRKANRRAEDWKERGAVMSRSEHSY